MNDRRMKQSMKMMGNQNAKGHGGKRRRTMRHYTAPHALVAERDLMFILDKYLTQ